MDFHDATLLTIMIEWAEGRVTVQLQTSEGICALYFSGVRSIAIPRRQEWGPSSSILKFKESAPGVWNLAVQSGDTLEIEARELKIESPSEG